MARISPWRGPSPGVPPCASVAATCRAGLLDLVLEGPVDGEDQVVAPRAGTIWLHAAGIVRPPARSTTARRTALSASSNCGSSPESPAVGVGAAEHEAASSPRAEALVLPVRVDAGDVEGSSIWRRGRRPCGPGTRTRRSVRSWASSSRSSASRARGRARGRRRGSCTGGGSAQTVWRRMDTASSAVPVESAPARRASPPSGALAHTEGGVRGETSGPGAGGPPHQRLMTSSRQTSAPERRGAGGPPRPEGVTGAPGRRPPSEHPEIGRAAGGRAAAGPAGGPRGGRR